MSSLRVADFGENIEESLLRTVFEIFGKITRCVIIRDNLGQSKRHGFIDFEAESAARKAVQFMNGRNILGATELQVQFVQPKETETYGAGAIFIKNLDFCIDEYELKDAFEIFGTIDSVKILRKQADNSSAGQAFVCFKYVEDATKAILMMNNTTIGQRQINVEFEKNKNETINKIREENVNKLFGLVQSTKKSTDTADSDTASMIGQFTKASLIAKNSARGEVIDRIHIMEGATGRSYKSVFGKYLNDDIKEIEIADTYIREHYQFQNLIIFLELCVKKCKNLKFMKLSTKPDQNKLTQQRESFDNIKNSLKSEGITLAVEFSDTLHDREIILSNGYIIKIGRGLHYFKAANPKYSLGLCDYDFRECFETNIDVFKCAES